MVAWLHARSSKWRPLRFPPPSTSSAAAWIDSWTSETSAWFVAIERPVTIAWSIVGRGMSVRWNVSGTFIPATRIPA